MAYSLLLVALAAGQDIAALTDLQRAHIKIPRSHVKGSSIVDMLQKMNRQLSVNVPAGLATAPCKEFSHGEIINILKTLHEARDPALEAVYVEADDNRRLQAGGHKTDDNATLIKEWMAEAQLLAANPALAPVLRDGRCYDVVMWWVHHIPAEKKEELASNGVLQKLPLMPIPELAHSQEDYPGVEAAARERAFSSFGFSSMCTKCHGAASPSSPASDSPDATDGPTWPPTFAVQFDEYFTSFFKRAPHGNNSGTFALDWTYEDPATGVKGAQAIVRTAGNADSLCGAVGTAGAPCTQLMVGGQRYIVHEDSCCRCCV